MFSLESGSCSEMECKETNDGMYEKDKNFISTVIYSTNNLTRPVSPDFANRVKYIGSSSSSWRNGYSVGPKPLCSILICDLRTSDSGKYYLRIKGKLTGLSEEVTLNVEGIYNKNRNIKIHLRLYITLQLVDKCVLHAPSN